MGTQKSRLTETIILSTHNIGFEGQIRILEHEQCPLSRALNLDIYQIDDLSCFNSIPWIDNTTVFQTTSVFDKMNYCFKLFSVCENIHEGGWLINPLPYTTSM